MAGSLTALSSTNSKSYIPRAFYVLLPLEMIYSQTACLILHVLAKTLQFVTKSSKKSDKKNPEKIRG